MIIWDNEKRTYEQLPESIEQVTSIINSVVPVSYTEACGEGQQRVLYNEYTTESEVVKEIFTYRELPTSKEWGAVIDIKIEVYGV